MDGMTEGKIALSQNDKTVVISKLVSDDPLLFELFDKTPVAERAEMLSAVLHIGALAMLEDRIHHLIDATEKELFPKLEGFKRMFERRKLEFEMTTQKGEKAEVDIVDLLNDYIQASGWNDYASQSGAMKGALARNKTGDVLCVIEFDEEKGEGQTRLGIEVKFDRSVGLGNPVVEDVFKAGDQLSGDLKKSTFDTAWSQLLETRANRECPFALMVFDRQIANQSVTDAVDDVAFVPGIPGFIVIVDSQSGDYRNLLITYRIARELALYHQRNSEELDVKILELLVARIVHYLSSARKISELVQKHTKAAVKMNKDVQKEMGKLVHLADFTQDYLRKFLEQKTLSAKDLTEFYYAAEAKVAWRKDNAALAEEIKSWEKDGSR